MDSTATIKDDADGDKLPASDKPTDADKKAKRRPSIRDLFGGDDSEEEVDDELKQLVAQQGSINVHYPIKMPIVLKTNFISEDKGIVGDEVPISKKWIPIYPEVEKNKSSGPKWKAIGWSEKDNQKTSTSASRRMDDSGQIGHSKDGITSTAGEGGASAAVRSVRVNNNGLKVEKKDIKGVIVERRFGFSRTVDLTSIGSTTVTSASATSLAAALVKADLTPSTSTEVVLVNSRSSNTMEASDKRKSDSEVVSATAEKKKKVRVCKHGRVIKKEKPKETTVAVEQLTVSRKRSQPDEPVEDKKPPKGKWTVVYFSTVLCLSLYCLFP